VPFFRKLIAEGAAALPITDARMTRFWITLQQGVDFVLKNFQRMQGGELYVPKIPSIRIMDLAESIAPGMAVEFVGIRPGEKLHEIMCPADDSHLTLDFGDHYVICPSIQMFRNVNFETNRSGETGKAVEEGFFYSSGNNPDFLTVAQLVQLNKELGL
jgi:UDP-N-acetylglucosamine 4,6-dehydratase